MSKQSCANCRHLKPIPFEINGVLHIMYYHCQKENKVIVKFAREWGWCVLWGSIENMD